MKRMIFGETIRQIEEKSMTLTYRFAWWGTKPGTCLLAVDKGRGMRRQPKPGNVIGVIEVTSATTVALDSITQEDVVLAGYPEMTRAEFLQLLIDGEGIGTNKSSLVRRLEFRYRDDLLSPALLHRRLRES